MILALWLRWQQTENWKWLLVIAAFLALDALVGSYILAWELRIMRRFL